VKAGVNTYELGGGRALKDLLSAPLSLHNISNVGCVCICLDLSKPGNCYESLQFWLKVVKDQIHSSTQALQNSKIDDFRRIKASSDTYWGKATANQERINRSFIPITVIGTKYDEFAKANEPVQKKLLC